MNVLKICCSEWKNASRDKRELSAYKELGMEVCVLAKGLPEDRGRVDYVDGYEVRRYSTKPFSRGPLKVFNRLFSVLYWANYARQIKADIISGHDIDGLTIGWLSNFFLPKKRKSKLIYDSHEFEIGRNKKRSKFATWLVCHWERFLIKRVDLAMMVNDSIADAVQKIHKLDTRPIVVRSTPDLWSVDEEKSNAHREEIMKSMADGVEFIVDYHGMVSKHRGIELLIQCLLRDEKLGLTITGNPDSEAYEEEIKNLSKELGVDNRVYFHRAVPLTELCNFVAAADCSATILPKEIKSYYYALPNKFFESIQSEVPVVVMDFPEMKNLTEKYDVGCTIEDYSVEAAYKAISKMCELGKAHFSSQLKVAKKELCWENEKNVLKEAIQNLSLL